ncbi:MAG TPA: methyltransferase domain-containing protein [Burkholderiales bacterium]
MKTISQKNVIRTYRFYAPFYDFLYGTVLEPGRRALSEAVGSIRPASILEIGVGTGLMLPRYPQASRIVGIDLSDEMLEIARQRANALTGCDICLQAMDAEILDFPDASFECVAIPYVLSVTPDPARLIAEARRVCVRGGRIFILNHFSGGRFWWFLEKVVQRVASRIGFRSDFNFDEQILGHDWEVLSVKNVNLLGLSRLVEIRNP